MPGWELKDKKEKKAVSILFDQLKDGIKPIFYNSEKVKLFEKNFAKKVGHKHAVAVSSGTAAIKTSLIAAGIKRGDEVITQAFTFIATVEAIMDLGAKPIITEIDETLNMCPKDLEKKITKKTKAIIPVHMLGVSVEIDQIKRIAKKHKIIVIDDNCEALGAKWKNKPLGSQFDACTWSFDNGKTITTGEGGMITTNNYKIYKLSLEYRDHGHENNPKFPRGKDTHRIYGFNFRTTELNAVIGLEQLKKLDFIVKKNKKNYYKFYELLKNYDFIKFRKIPKYCSPLYDCLIFNLENKNKTLKLLNQMKIKNMITKNVPDAIEWHFAIYWDHIFKKYGFKKRDLKKKFLKSQDLLNRSIAIPIFVKESKKNLLLRINKLKSILDKL